jgi:hypothetical protein
MSAAFTSLTLAGLLSGVVLAACGEEATDRLTRRTGEDGAAPGDEPLGEADLRTAGHARRLTHDEYRRAVRDLLDVEPDVGKLPIDQKIGFFANHVRTGTVSRELAEAYLDAAEATAEKAAPRLAGLAGCDGARAAADADACTRALVERLGRRAYRRPLTDADKTAYLALFAENRGEAFERGAQAVVTAMLVSPHFLYRLEFGRHDASPTGDVQLTSYEVASRLAFAFWSSAPDDTLLDAARMGELSTIDQLRGQAEPVNVDETPAA